MHHSDDPTTQQPTVSRAESLFIDHLSSSPRAKKKLLYGHKNKAILSCECDWVCPGDNKRGGVMCAPTQQMKMNARQAFSTADSSCSAPGSVTARHAGFQRTLSSHSPPRHRPQAKQFIPHSYFF